MCVQGTRCLNLDKDTDFDYFSDFPQDCRQKGLQLSGDLWGQKVEIKRGSFPMPKYAKCT